MGGSRSGEGKSSSAADVVVQEIKSKGGKAVADYSMFHLWMSFFVNEFLYLLVFCKVQFWC